MNPTATTTRSPARRPRGFTLIELMITVAIIAILSAVAYPAYTDQVAKGRRAEARTAMLDAAQWMERFYAENYRYDRNTAGATAASLFSARYGSVPATGTANYTLSLDASAANTFTVLATRTGPMTGDKCGNYATNQAGVKGLRSFDSGKYASEAAAVKACW